MKMRHFLSTSSSDTCIVKKKKENNYDNNSNKNEVYDDYNEIHKNDTSINKQTAIQILTTEILSSESDNENKINYDLVVSPKYFQKYEDADDEDNKTNLKRNLFTIYSSESDNENKINYDLVVSPKYLQKYEDADDEHNKTNLKRNLFTISSSDSFISENDINSDDKDVIKTTWVNLEEQEGNTVENWRNKGDKKKRRSLYLDNHPEIRIKKKKFTNMKGKRQIDIARNGTLLRPITVNKRKIRVLNTCPLDSILQILATNVIDSVTYANVAKASECDIMKLAYYLAMNGTNIDFYKRRISIVELYTKSKVELAQVPSHRNNCVHRAKRFKRNWSLYSIYKTAKWTMGTARRANSHSS
ncbi:hypothetical protein ACI65C_004832 [Semiaphis heraclei]